MKNLYLKNSFLVLLVLSFVFAGLSSCSSDDDNGGGNFEPFTLTYTGSKLQLVGMDTPKNASVVVAATSNSDVQVTLNNALEGKSILVLKGGVVRDSSGYSVFAEGDGYGFVGIVSDGMMTATITKK